ncbi:MAG: helicase, partial [Bacteroidota bacterium]
MNVAKNILKQYWGYDQFRPLQEDIVQAVLQKSDTLALLPTGGGKSICFQVPAMAMEGICIVVCPLIALMQDQVDQLAKRGIKAAAIYSGMHARQIDYLLDNCIYGDIKFLYVSPERLKTDLFIARAKQMKIALIAIDEAHCISQWGYDFRPPYLEIVQFKELFPETPCIALTASANEEVKKDIIEKLALRRPAVFQKSFSRANLSYSVLWEQNKEMRLLKMLEKIQGSAIIYVRNRKKTESIAQFLLQNDIAADFYHAGLLPKQRNEKQLAWINNHCRVMVATNAFGMGIDKPDVRL